VKLHDIAIESQSTPNPLTLVTKACLRQAASGCGSTEPASGVPLQGLVTARTSRSRTWRRIANSNNATIDVGKYLACTTKIGMEGPHARYWLARRSFIVCMCVVTSQSSFRSEAP
jgi:hypothetical protein